MPGRFELKHRKKHSPPQHTHLHKDGEVRFFSPFLSFWLHEPNYQLLCVCVCVCAQMRLYVSAGRWVSRPWQSDFMHHKLCHKTHTLFLGVMGGGGWLAHSSSGKQTWWFRGASCDGATGRWLAFLLTSPPSSYLRYKLQILSCSFADNRKTHSPVRPEGVSGKCFQQLCDVKTEKVLFCHSLNNGD